MAIRIWHQSMSELEQLPIYDSTLREHIAKIVDPDTEVVLHGLAPGSFGAVAPADVVHYPILFHRILGQILPMFEEAEKQGFDAIVIAGYSEAFLREARSAVNIPVASMAESGLLTACSMARKSGLVTLSPLIAWRAEAIVRSHGLQDRVAGIYTLDPPVNEHDLVQAFENPEPLLASFTQAAERAISDHADVVIPAEGLLNELLYSRAVREINGVSVLDSIAVAMLYTEMMVKLRERTGLHAGRQWEYRKPSDELLRALSEARPRSSSN